MDFLPIRVGIVSKLCHKYWYFSCIFGITDRYRFVVTSCMLRALCILGLVWAWFSRHGECESVSIKVGLKKVGSKKVGLKKVAIHHVEPILHEQHNQSKKSFPSERDAKQVTLIICKAFPPWKTAMVVLCWFACWTHEI